MIRFADGIPQSGPAGPVALHADCREVTIAPERVARKGDTPTSVGRCKAKQLRRGLIQRANCHVIFARSRGVGLCFALPSPEPGLVFGRGDWGSWRICCVASRNGRTQPLSVSFIKRMDHA